MKTRWARALLSVILLMIVHAGVASAQDVELRGFLLETFSGRIAGRSSEENTIGDWLVREDRLRLNLSAWAESIEASLRAEADLEYDAVERAFALNLRQAYIDYTKGRFDVRLGRQIVTWGVGDLLFVNDVFPKDWVSFFAGRPLEYLKVGVEGLRVRYWSDLANVELVGVFSFEPDIVPTPDRFVFADPMARLPRVRRLPADTVENGEIGLRVFRKVGGFDLAANAFKGFWPTPSAQADDLTAPSRVTLFYPKLRVYGVSAQGRAFGAILSAEAGFYDSPDDTDGSDPLIPNSQARFFVGYQRSLGENTTVGVQYYGEWMRDFAAYTASLPAGFPAQKEYRDIVTARFDRLLSHQTWRLSLFTFVSPAERDYLVQARASYNFSDDLSAEAGINVFGGEKSTTSFGQLDKNDNAYLWTRFSF